MTSGDIPRRFRPRIETRFRSDKPPPPIPGQLHSPTFTPNTSPDSDIDVTIECSDAGAHLFYTLGNPPSTPQHIGDVAVPPTIRIGSNSGVVNSGDGVASFSAMAYEVGFTDSYVATSGTFGTPEPPPMDLPRGVWFLKLPGITLDPEVIGRDYIAGVALGDNWYQLESTQGVFDWSRLDDAINIVTNAGKLITILVADSGGSSNIAGKTPPWVFTLPGVQTYSFVWSDGSTITIPLQWNQPYIDAKKVMLAAVADRYSGNSLVRIAHVGYAYGQGDDWAFPCTFQPDGLPDGLSPGQRLQNAGYTSALIRDAAAQIYQTMFDNWGSEIIVWTALGTVDFSFVSHGLEPNKFALARDPRDAARTLYGQNRLMVASESISAFITPAPPPPNALKQLLYESQPCVGGQALWNCFGDTSYRMNAGVPADPSVVLMSSVDRLVGYGGLVYEIYPQDCTNLITACEYAAAQLAG